MTNTYVNVICCTAILVIAWIWRYGHLQANSNSDHIAIAKTFEQVARIYNPSGQEHKMMEFISEWLHERSIPFISDIAWGIYFKQEFNIPCNSSRKGVLLSAHMDSDHLSNTIQSLHETKFTLDNQGLFHFDKLDGEIGLDDKTGITVILSIIDKLLNASVTGCVTPVTVVFSVQEEVGQKGMMLVPTSILESIAKDASYGIVVDRMSKKFKNQRHVVTSYNNVSLLSQGEVFLDKLNLAAKRAGISEKIVDTLSDSCSDALEWRGRIDAEVLLPKSSPLYEEYQNITLEMQQQIKILPTMEKISSFKTGKRAERYELMRRIRERLKQRQGDKFSVVNLSLDYDEHNRYMSMIELENTVDLICMFILDN